MVSFIYFNNSGPNINLSMGLLQEIGVLHLRSYRISKGLIPVDRLMLGPKLLKDMEVTVK